MQLSWSSEPFSRWSAFSCFPAFKHMFETWPSKVNLASISMPSTFIVSEDGRDIISSDIQLSVFDAIAFDKHGLKFSWICSQWIFSEPFHSRNNFFV